MHSEADVADEDGAVAEALLSAEGIELLQQLLAVTGKLHGTRVYWPPLAVVSAPLSQSPANEKTESDPVRALGSGSNQPQRERNQH